MRLFHPWATAQVVVAALVVGVVFATPIDAAETSGKAPPPAPFQKASDVMGMDDFFPGMGQLYVDPKTLPVGPYLAYDHDGNLVSTTYMITLSTLKEKDFDNLPAPFGEVDHVDIYLTPGHAGIEHPHAHVVMWHVPVEGEAAVAK